MIWVSTTPDPRMVGKVQGVEARAVQTLADDHVDNPPNWLSHTLPSTQVEPERVAPICLILTPPAAVSSPTLTQHLEAPQLSTKRMGPGLVFILPCCPALLK